MPVRGGKREQSPAQYSETKKETKSMSIIINEAVKLTNENSQKQVVAQAQLFIAKIQGEQSSIKGSEERIKVNVKELEGISASSISVASVLGDVRLPADGNPNTATILKAIEEANKAQQDGVKISSTNLVGSITAEQRNIASCQERIAKLRQELLNLGAASVTVATVMGS